MLLFLLLLPLLTAASPLPPNPALLACLSDASLTPITSSSTSYDNSTSPFNTRVHPFPLAVVYPRNNLQVAAAVVCASKNGVAASARSGGHSYGALLFFSILGGKEELTLERSFFRPRRDFRSSRYRPLLVQKGAALFASAPRRPLTIERAQIAVFGNGTAVVGAGNRLGAIALKLAAKGHALPHSVSYVLPRPPRLEC